MTPNDFQVAAPPARSTRTVLIVDIKESTRLMESNEDDTVQRWLRLVKHLENVVLPVHRGRLVKSLGDGLLLEFQSVRPALKSAFAIQNLAEEANDGIAPQCQIHLKIGIQVGDLITDERDVYGHAVNVAARLTALAGPGEILVSAAVRDQLAPMLDADIEDLGERRLRNMEGTIRAYRAWPPGLPARRVIAASIRMGDRPSIAVLPFRNLSGDTQHDILGDVIADEVIGYLSSISDLVVISRLSTTPFRNLDYEPRNIAEALGVTYLLTGSMQVSGSKARLRAELVGAASGRVEWAGHFDDSSENLFELQDKMSLTIAQKIVPFVRASELKRTFIRLPENLTAYERMLQAIDFLHQGTKSGMDRARTLLEMAIHSDPTPVAPLAWLARLYVLRVGENFSSDPQQDKIQANRYAQSALDRDGTDAWALSVTGLVEAYLNKDLENAIARLDHALDINPNAASAWVWSTAAHAWLGHGEEAVKRSHRAIELSPFDPHVHIFTSIAGTAHAVAGQYDEAIEYCRRSLRQNRMYRSTHRILTLSLALAGRIDEARLAATDLLSPEIEPALTVGAFRNRYPGNSSAHIDAFCEALLSAGVPP